MYSDESDASPGAASATRISLNAWLAAMSLRITTARCAAYQRGNNQQNRLNSLWFGDSANMNKLALETALAMAV